MAQQSHRRSRRDLTERLRRGQRLTVKLPGLGRVNIPHPEELAYCGGLAVLAALDIIEWPVAGVIAVGHILASDSQDRFANFHNAIGGAAMDRQRVGVHRSKRPRSGWASTGLGPRRSGRCQGSGGARPRGGIGP